MFENKVELWELKAAGESKGSGSSSDKMIGGEANCNSDKKEVSFGEGRRSSKRGDERDENDDDEDRRRQGGKGWGHPEGGPQWPVKDYGDKK